MRTAVLVIILAVAGCASLATDFQPSELSYRRDVRTGICYAVSGRTGRSYTGPYFSTVPCTPAVLDRVPSSERPAT